MWRDDLEVFGPPLRLAEVLVRSVCSVGEGKEGRARCLATYLDRKEGTRRKVRTRRRGTIPRSVGSVVETTSGSEKLSAMLAVQKSGEG